MRWVYAHVGAYCAFFVTVSVVARQRKSLLYNRTCPLQEESRKRCRDYVVICFVSFPMTYFVHSKTDFNATTRAVKLWFVSCTCVLRECHVGGYGRVVGCGNCPCSIPSFTETGNFPAICFGFLFMGFCRPSTERTVHVFGRFAIFLYHPLPMMRRVCMSLSARIK